MAEKSKMTSESDFELLSSKVKLRVKNLIEKRLNSKTIILFAQEYEQYDIYFREQLVDYINFLMEQEKETWSNYANNSYERSNSNSWSLKREDFLRRQEDIKQFQIYLKAPSKLVEQKNEDANLKQSVVKTTIPVVKTIKVAETKKVSTTKVKKDANRIKETKENKVSTISKMLLEAKKREEMETKEAKKIVAERTQEEKKKELQRKELEKRKELQKKETEKKRKEVAEKKKTFKPEPVKQTVIAKPKTVDQRDYEKEQLWKEIYGKTRAQTLSERKATEIVEEDNVEHDKKPTFNETNEVQKTFTILGKVFLIEETTDPKNKYFSFWYNLKKRVGTSNISIWLNIYPKKQKSILRKRMRLETNMGVWDKLKSVFTPNHYEKSVKKQKVEKIKRKDIEVKSIEKSN